MARIPSIQALRALESVARLGTIWRAAEELNLTRSAVSHQLRVLERDLDFSLMLRNGNRAALSPRALEYAGDVRRALGLISMSGNRVSHKGLSGTLKISCPGGFASAWLSLHLGAFAEANPDVVISLMTPARLDSTTNPEVDTFITFSHDNRSGVLVEPLLPVEFTPMCSPEYLQKMGGMLDNESLARATLLHISGFADWEAWMRLRGLPREQAHRGIIFSDMNVAYSAVLAGQGVTIGDVIVWGESLVTGRLVRPLSEKLHTDSGYYLCTPEEKIKQPIIAAFHTWLKHELRKSSDLRPES